MNPKSLICLWFSIITRSLVKWRRPGVESDQQQGGDLMMVEQVHQLIRGPWQEAALQTKWSSFQDLVKALTVSDSQGLLLSEKESWEVTEKESSRWEQKRKSMLTPAERNPRPGAWCDGGPMAGSRVKEWEMMMTTTMIQGIWPVDDPDSNREWLRGSSATEIQSFYPEVQTMTLNIGPHAAAQTIQKPIFSYFCWYIASCMKPIVFSALALEYQQEGASFIIRALVYNQGPHL